VLSARVEYLNVPSGLMLAGPAPDTVDVQVQGNRAALRRLTSDDFGRKWTWPGSAPGTL